MKTIVTVDLLDASKKDMHCFINNDNKNDNGNTTS